MAESPALSEPLSDEDLPGYGAINTVDGNDNQAVQPTVLFPHRKTSLERTKNRKQYSEMIEIALYELNETRTGSSRQGVVKYIRANFDVGESANRYVCLALAKLIEKERVIRKSGVGANGRFRLSQETREAITMGKKPKANPPKVLMKGKKASDKSGKGEGAKSKTVKSKTKNKGGGDKAEGDSDKENKAKTKKTGTKGRKTGAQSKKDGEAASKKTTSKKAKAEVESKSKGKANASQNSKSKETKSTTSKSKAKEDKPAKDGKSKTALKNSKDGGKGKINQKEKANHEDGNEAPSKRATKSNQVKAAKKNEEKSTKPKTKTSSKTE